MDDTENIVSFNVALEMLGGINRRTFIRNCTDLPIIRIGRKIFVSTHDIHLLIQNRKKTIAEANGKLYFDEEEFIEDEELEVY